MTKLHDGSRWEGDTVTTSAETTISIESPPWGTFLYLTYDASGDFLAVPPEDALAVLRRAKLDPLAIAAKVLIEKLELQDNHPDVDEVVRKLKELLP